MKIIEAKKDNRIHVIWQYPLYSTYKGLQLNLADGSIRVFKTGNPAVDFINYKQFLIEKGDELKIDKVLFTDSFADFVSKEECPYHIAYFYEDGSRVQEKQLHGLDVRAAMGMFDYYICKDDITHINDLQKLHHKVMRNVRRKDKGTHKTG